MVPKHVLHTRAFLSSSVCSAAEQGSAGDYTSRWRGVVGQLLWAVSVEVLSPRSTKSRSTAHLADGTAGFHW